MPSKIFYGTFPSLTLAVTVAIGSLIVHLEGSIRLIVTVAILQSTLTSFALKVKLSAPEYPTAGVNIRVRLPRLDGNKNPYDGGGVTFTYLRVSILTSVALRIVFLMFF